MAINNFVPEIWSAALIKALRDRLTYAQVGVINRNYEGEIARAGDTVHLTNFVDPAVRSYSKNGSITWDLLTDATQALVVNQSNYFAFKVDDIDKRQALGGFVEEATVGAAYNLAAEADEYVGGLMVAGADAANQLGAVSVGEAGDAYATLVKLRTALTRTNTPDDGRFVVVPPEFYALLLQDDRFIRLDASGTTAGLRNGQAGSAAGFTVIESNRVPEEAGEDETAYSVVAGHSIATTYAEQIAETEALRLESTFGDGVRGLHLYGAKVVRPKQLATAEVTVAPADGDDGVGG